MIKGIKVFGAFFALSVVAAQAATVSGRVTASGSGDAIAGAKVVLISQRGDVDSTSTNNQGNYSLEGVAVGPHTLVASREGYQPSTTTVNVGQGGNTVNITLTPTSGGGRTGRIAGTVRQEGNNQIIAGARVVVSVRMGGRTTPVDTAGTDAQGRYITAALPVGTYSLAVSASGYVGETQEGVDVNNNDTTTQNFTLAREVPPAGVIAGKVTDADTDAPLAGVLVVLRRRASGDFNAPWVARESTLTAADGNYRFSSLPSSLLQPYSVVARKAGYQTYTSGPLTVGQTLPTTHNISLEKVVMGSLKVFVARDTAGRPAIAGAALLVAPADEPLQFIHGTTDAKGLSVFPGLVGGRYNVSVRADGYVSEATVVTVDGTGDSVAILLARATSANSKVLSGLIRDASSKPLAMAKIVFRASGSGLTIVANSNAAGDFDFRGIPSSVTGGTVTVEMTGYATHNQQVSLPSSSNFLNVTLEKPVSVAPGLRFANGFRLSGSRGALAVEFPASPWAGRLSAYDARGALAYSGSVPAGTSRMSLPSKSSLRFLLLERGGMVEKLQVAPVR